jgi:integrase
MAAVIEEGPVFRTIDRWGNVRAGSLSGNAIALIVKGCATRAGMDADRFAAHSLRSGFITEAANAGVQSRDIMAQTGHNSETVMLGYIQDAGLGAIAAVKAAFREQ